MLFRPVFQGKPVACRYSLTEVVPHLIDSNLLLVGLILKDVVNG
jgi:hypothetical protein